MGFPLPDPQINSPGRSPDQALEAVQRNLDALALEVASVSTSASSADKNKVMPFTAAATVTLNHNLGKRPAVSVVDSAGEEWALKVEHLSDNSVRINFEHPFSGTAYFN